MKHIVFLIALVALLSACVGPNTTSTPIVATPSPVNTESVAPTATPHAIIYTDPTQLTEERVEDLLARMTLEEKIGQMTQVEKDSIQPGDIRAYFIGSILSGGGGSPVENTPQAWYAMVSGFQNEALQTRLAIPIIYGVDAVHGHGNLQGATIFPHNIGLGAANDPALVEQIGRATAEEMLATGIPWNFAPVVAVVQDTRWGRTYESYSESTALVTPLAAAYIMGMQNLAPNDLATPGQALFTLSTAKHFIGDGATIWGSARQNVMNMQYMLDQGNMQVNEETLRALFLPPYKAAMEAGAMSVMASFSSWKGTKVHAQKYLLTDILKTELGFTGFVVSDWGAIDQIDPNDYYTSVVTAINAGVDMNMVPYDYVKFIDTMKKAVANGDIPHERVDDAVRRILRAKFMLGLFEQPMPDPKYQASVRSEEHLALAREAVRKSLVLLQNNNVMLPLSKETPLIFISGAGANSTGLMSGGWTIEWQGVAGNLMAGTTIYEAVKNAVGANTQVVYQERGTFANQVDANNKPLNAEVGIVVVSEQPYAEGVGDSANPALSAGDINRIAIMHDRAKKVVVIILSGRPLIITDQLTQADAWVAAWLPGTEGAGITDVLFGDYPFAGKLPYSWPRSADQYPININNGKGKDALFPFGYGLK